MNNKKRLIRLQQQVQAALNSKEFQHAKTLLIEASRLDKNNSEIWFLLSAVNGALGDAAAAAQSSETAIRLRPTNPDAHYNLGTALQTLGRHREAAAAFRNAIKLRSNFAAAHLMLGNSLIELELADAAADSYLTAQRLAPLLGETYYNLGKIPATATRSTEIEKLLTSTLEKYEGLAEAHLGLALLLRQKGEISEAVLHAKRAIELAPELDLAYGVSGDIFNQDMHPELAAPEFRRALELDPDSIPFRLGLAKALLSMGQIDESSRLVNEAYSRMPTNPNVIQAVAENLRKRGRHEEAADYYRQLLRIDPPMYSAYEMIASTKAFDESCDEIREIESVLTKDDRLALDAKPSLHFALGKIYNDTKAYDAAFHHYSEANKLIRNTLDYDTHDIQQHVDRIIEFFSRDFFTNNGYHGNENELPIFIVGMPRSGTTLTETIISSHPLAHAGGERTDIDVMSRHMGRIVGRPYPDWVAHADSVQLDQITRSHLERLTSLGGDATRVTDKMPHNFLGVGLIRYLYPRARIVHIRRNPIDNCLSIFFQRFNSKNHPYAWNLRELGLYYREYRRLMAHWRSVLPGPYLELSYEDLIDTQEATSRKLIEFCGLPWDDICLQFHKTNRTVETASHWQVRQPIYNTSKERWRRYEMHLSPLLEALDLSSITD